MRLPYMTNTDWILLVSGTVIGLLIYVFIWNKSKPIAIVLLIIAFSWFGYWGVDWAHWDTYFKVDWGSGGLRPAS